MSRTITTLMHVLACIIAVLLGVMLHHLHAPVWVALPCLGLFCWVYYRLVIRGR